MADYLTTDTELTSVANAIRTKGGTSGSLVYPAGFVSAIGAIPTGITPTGTIQITENGTVDVTNYASADVNVSGGGGNPEAGVNDVNFIDFDGTIRYSYSASDFANLASLPPNPVHDGLTAQGWNWSLSDAKSYVAENGSLWIGQSYITSDGKSRLYISIPNSGLCAVRMYIKQTKANGVTVDWGDNTPTETKSSTGAIYFGHTYSSVGDYVITLECTDGYMSFGRDDGSIGIFGNYDNVAHRPGLMCLKKVEVGSGVQQFYDRAFARTGIETITIPTSLLTNDSHEFNYAESLKSITLPSGFNFNVMGGFITYSGVKKLSYPKSATTKLEFLSLKINDVTIPPATSLDYAFQHCYFLAKLTIPSSVTSIGSNTFYNCTGMKEYHFKSTTPPTLSNTNAFTGIPSDCIIYVPSASLSAYKSASNWSTYASKMVGE